MEGFVLTGSQCAGAAASWMASPILMTHRDQLEWQLRVEVPACREVKDGQFRSNISAYRLCRGERADSQYAHWLRSP
jgi:hypothetical protein